MKYKAVLVALFAIGSTSAALAQSTAMPGMSGQMMSGMRSRMPQCMSMMKQGLGPADKDYDKRFIDMMIMHHQGAISMSQDALKKARHPQLKKMAQDIINSQEREIQQMQAWRNEWYGKQ